MQGYFQIFRTSFGRIYSKLPLVTQSTYSSSHWSDFGTSDAFLTNPLAPPPTRGIDPSNKSRLTAAVAIAVFAQLAIVTDGRTWDGRTDLQLQHCRLNAELCSSKLNRPCSSINLSTTEIVYENRPSLRTALQFHCTVHIRPWWFRLKLSAK